MGGGRLDRARLQHVLLDVEVREPRQFGCGGCLFHEPWVWGIWWGPSHIAQVLGPAVMVDAGSMAAGGRGILWGVARPCLDPWVHLRIGC